MLGKGVRAALLAALLVVLLAGCTATPEPPTIVRLTLTLEGGGEFYGHHCGGAHIEGDTLYVERHEAKILETGASLIYIETTLKGPWVTTGSAPYATTLPLEVRGESGGRVYAKIEQCGEDYVVQGKVVGLPYAWRDAVRASGDQPAVTVHGKLEQGPSRATTYDRPGMCA